VFEAGPDWEILVNGQLRPRLYAHSGKDFRGADSEWREVVTQRARLGLMAEEASGLALKIEVQDARIWGEETDTLDDASANGFDVRQAFAVLPLLESLALKIGRQEIDLDGERLVSSVAWTQRGRSFDAARLTWSAFGEVLTLQGLYAKVEETGRDPDGAVPFGRSGDTDFAGAHVSVEFLPEHEIAPVYLFRSDRSADEIRHTIGTTLRGRVRGLEYGLEAFYQLGDLAGSAIDAFMAAARLSYTVALDQKPRMSAWAETLSGGGGDPAGTFDTLYGNNHDYYGEMDFFTTMAIDTANLGLVDLGGQLGSDIVEHLRAHADFHHFRSEDETPSGEQTFGNELDLSVRWDIHDHVSLRGTYGHFWPGAAVRHVLAGADPTAQPAVDLESEQLVFTTVDVVF
jgi:hypothetical protein